MGVPSGGNVGNAQGRITIDTRDFERARAAAQQFAQSLNQAFGQVNSSSNRAQQGITGLAGSLSSLGGALGVGLGVRELVNFAVETNKVATAFDRQNVAARNLAGSQGQLNELLATYERATGGAVDKAQSLADVTRLLAIGFGDSTQELERFVRAARGISLATGQSQDYVIQQLQLAIANQSTMRLDQIGLGVSEVKQRVAELRRENASMTEEMAYQEAVLSAAEEKFGDLTKSVEAQVTGLEDLRKAWKDFHLQIGQTSQGPVNFIAEAMANWLRDTTRDLRIATEVLMDFGQALGLISRQLPLPSMTRFAQGSASRDASRHGLGRRGGGAAIDPFAEDRDAATLNWWRSGQDITSNMNSSIREENSRFAESRRNIEENYQKSTLREAEDFARARLLAERSLNKSILDIAEESARQFAKWEADTERAIADARDDANKDLTELDENFQRDRLRRERKYRDDMLSAAGRLDAIALLELRKSHARETEDAKEAHDKQRDNILDALHEREQEERESLQRRIEEQRDNDARRIEDTKQAFEEQKRQEDDERAIRLARQREDHDDQLEELGRQHGERIQQIKDHAQEERDQLDEEFTKELDKLGKQTEARKRYIDQEKDYARKAFDDFWDHVDERMMGIRPGTPAQGPRTRPPEWPSLLNPPSFGADRLATSATVSSARSVEVGGVQISVIAAPNQSPHDIAAEVRDQFTRLLESIN